MHSEGGTIAIDFYLCLRQRFYEGAPDVVPSFMILVSVLTLNLVDKGKGVFGSRRSLVHASH